MSYKKISKLISKRTEKQKAEAWHAVVKKRLEFWEHLKKMNGNKSAYDKLFELEFDGGICFKCGVAWQEREFDNSFMKGKYYVPGCHCFARCPECKSYLYDMHIQYGKVYQCDNCGFDLYNAATDTIRYGEEFESWYNNLRGKAYFEQKTLRCAFM
jgi:predicted Zn-ribbon and HTH transcriptional regulator